MSRKLGKALRKSSGIDPGPGESFGDISLSWWAKGKLAASPAVKPEVHAPQTFGT